MKLDALSLRLWTNVLNLWKIQVGSECEKCDHVPLLVSFFLVNAIVIVCRLVHIIRGLKK